MQHRTKVLVILFILAACLSGCDYFVSPDGRVERARKHIENGDQRAAVVELKNALQKNPNLHEARVMLADLALWLGDAESAEGQLERLPSGFTRSGLEELRVRTALALNRFEDVRHLLSRQDSDLSAARREMYGAYLMLEERRDLDKAQLAFERAIGQEDSLIAARVGLIETLQARSLPQQALEAATRLTQQHPESAEAWFAYAQAIGHTNAPEALRALERARDLAPGRLDLRRHVVLLTALAEHQLQVGKNTDARVTATRLVQLAPGSPIAALISSRVSMASNDYATATADLRRVVNRSPNLAQARFMLGAALAAQGNLEQSEQELQQVIDQSPQFIEARRLLGHVRMRLQDPDGALQALVPGLGESADVRYLMLIDAARSNIESEGVAIELLEKALVRDPSNRGLIRQLASAYLQSGAAFQALTLLRNAAKDPPEPQQEALHLQAILEVEGPSAAKAYADSIIERHRADSRVVSLVAAFYAQLGDFGAARRTLGTQLDSGADHPDLLLALARIEWAAREPQRALDALRRLSRSHPDFTAGRIALAEAEWASGHRDEAREQLKVAAKNDPAAAAPRMMLARLALAEQDAATAEALIAEARKGADAAGVEGAAGLMYLSHGRYDQAILHLQAALNMEPGVASWWLHLGRAHMALNQHAPARQSFERALSIRSRWTAAEGALAFLDLQQGASDAAMQRTAALRAARPRDVEAVALDAQVQYALRRYPEAVRAFDDAIAIRPSAALALGAYEARRAVEDPEAIKPLQEWLAQHPRDARVRLALADAYVASDRREAAAAEYRTITIANPRNVAALNNLAWLYYELNDPRATDTARRASAEAPHSPEVGDTLGWILVERGNVEEGLAILERALAAAPRNPEIGYHHAVALIRAGNTEQGRARLRDLLEAHPTFASRAEAERLLRET